ncbi:MAG: hypothetical protein H7258_11415 [Ferruginibacter sp.]|nr:hypothetical protein [Ferruginibacter sp.]
MSKRNLFAGLLLLGTLTIFSCKKDSPNNNAACANNTGWLKNGHAAVFINTPIFITADSLYASFEEVSTGVFKSTSRFDDGTLYPSQSNYLQACDNSIYQAVAADLVNKQEVYRINGNVGDTWTFTTTSSGGNSITTVTTITQKNVSKTVPAGTFVCDLFHQVSTSSAGGSATTDTYINNAAGPVLVDGTSVHYELARKNY